MRRTTVRSVLLASALASALVAGLMAAPVSAAPPEGARENARLATPRLLEVGVAAGRIDRDTANLYLAYALSPQHDRVPFAYRSNVPWDGTIPLLELRRQLAAGTAGRYEDRIRSVIEGPDGAENTNVTCSSFPPAQGGANRHQSAHFVIDYGTVTGGLSITDYATSLETSWSTEITTFGWAAPPLHPNAGGRYGVVIDDLGDGLYGFVDIYGTYAGLAGNNPNTAWNDGDAYRSCMALNRDYSGFPGSSQQALDATTAHEFNHSIQFGYGALTGSGQARNVFAEGGATWMEDEVFDASNDNHNYIWPDFERAMANYVSNDAYPYWVVFRAITERYSAGGAGGGEDVMQRFWELTSQGSGTNLSAMAAALTPEGTTLADAYHAAAVALRFNRACGGGYAYPYCLEEGPQYLTAAGAPASQGTISSAGGSFSGSVRDNYALNWVKLPSTGPYDVTLQNKPSGQGGGGQLRGSIACDTGSTISIAAFPAVVGAGASTTIAGFSPTGCLAGTVYAVITNQNQTAPDPSGGTARNYQLSTSGGGGGGGGGDANVNVQDFKFQPKAPTIDQGDTVQWSFVGPSSHTATDSTAMALFGSGTKAPGSTSTFTFVGAGNYAYRCTIHPDMVGTIKVPVTASPSSGGTGTTFTVVWSSGAAPPGFDWDVQVRRPGQKWKPWKMDQTALSSAFVPDIGAGTYQFRAHLERNSNGAVSKWSVPATITVS
jgi:plastocyanin